MLSRGSDASGHAKDLFDRDVLVVPQQSQRLLGLKLDKNGL